MAGFLTDEQISKLQEDEKYSQDYEIWIDEKKANANK